MRISASVLLCVALALVSCSRNRDPVDSEAALAKQPAQKTVYDTQLRALQKAKDVQQTVDQQKKDLDQKLKDAGE